MFEESTIVTLPSLARAGMITAEKARKDLATVERRFGVSARPPVLAKTYRERRYGDIPFDTRVMGMLGYVPQTTGLNSGHVNVGRTVTGAVLTGGISLMLGGSRTKGNETITFVRTQGPSPADQVISELERLESLGSPEHVANARSRIEKGEGTDWDRAFMKALEGVLGVGPSRTVTRTLSESGFESDKRLFEAMGAETISISYSGGGIQWALLIVLSILTAGLPVLGLPFGLFRSPKKVIATYKLPDIQPDIQPEVAA